MEQADLAGLLTEHGAARDSERVTNGKCWNSINGNRCFYTLAESDTVSAYWLG